MNKIEDFFLLVREYGKSRILAETIKKEIRSSIFWLRKYENLCKRELIRLRDYVVEDPLGDQNLRGFLGIWLRKSSKNCFLKFEI